MKFFIEKLNFTKNEIKVIVFLLSVLLIGLCIKITKGVVINDDFDYSKTDKMFQSGLQRLAELEDSADVYDSTIFSGQEKEIIAKVNAREDSLSVKTGSKKNKKEDVLKGKSINLNTASKEQLVLLPGVGESTAEKIILYRTEKGKFQKPEDIMKIKGIGKKKYEKLKEYITVE